MADLSLCPSGPAGEAFEHIFKTSKCPIWDDMYLFLIFSTLIHYSFSVSHDDVLKVHKYYHHKQVKVVQIQLEVSFYRDLIWRK